MKKILWLICTLIAINAFAQESVINTNYGDSGTTIFRYPYSSPNSSTFSPPLIKELSSKRTVYVVHIRDLFASKDSLNLMFFDNDGKLIKENETDDGLRLRLPFADYGFKKTYIDAVTEQPDGKILIAGRDITSLTVNHAFVMRCMPDGSLDTSFGENGMAKQVFYGEIQDFRGLEIQMAKSIALDSKQNILIGVTYRCECTDDTAMILRFLPTGLPDPSFGNGGILRVNSGNEKYGGGVTQLTVTNNDKILMFGGDGNIPERFENHWVVKRFNEGGTLDESFGVQGKSFVQAQNRYQNIAPSYMRLDSKNRIVLGHYYIKNLIRIFYSFGLIRLDESGFMDESFGDHGVVLIDYKDSSFTSDFGFRADMELQENDKIVFGATLNDVKMNPTIYDAIVYRFNEDGSKDQNFADNGVYECNFKGVFDTVDTQDGIDKLEFKANGDILLLGSTSSFNKSTGVSFGGRFLRLLNGDPTRLPWSVRIRRWIRNHVLHFTDNDPGTSTAYYTIAKNVNGNATPVAKLPRNNSGVYSFSLPVADKTTTYTVTAMQSNGEAVSSFQITDVSASATHTNLKLWPNPVSNFVNIEAGFAIKTIEIQHIQKGIIQKITGNNARTMQVQIAQLQPGIYSITITGDNGERVQKKFVKE